MLVERYLGLRKIALHMWILNYKSINYFNACKKRQSHLILRNKIIHTRNMHELLLSSKLQQQYFKETQIFAVELILSYILIRQKHKISFGPIRSW